MPGVEERGRPAGFTVVAWARFALPKLLCGLLTFSAHAELPQTVAQALRQAGIPESSVAIEVDDLDAARPLLQHGSERSLNPASLMKLVTTLAVLDYFGPAHTFTTHVLLDGALKDGILDGRLILRGGGDPALTLERFWLLLREIRARGVREIHGEVVLDDGDYQIDPADPAAFDAAPLRPYNAQPAALLVNFNSVTLRLGRDAGAVHAAIDPPLDAPLLVNGLSPRDGPCMDVREQMRLEAGRLILDGGYAESCGDRAIALNLLAPAATTAAWFRQLWGEQGGKLVGNVVSGATPVTARPLLAFESQPVALLVRDTNKFSNNVMARMLFLNLGAARFGAPATWDKGVRAVRSWLVERDLLCEPLELENGAGLSRSERITAHALSRLLRWATRQPLWFDFAASLPAVGQEGTQRHRLRDTATTGRAWLKSGSLKGARNLAGYVLTANGGRRVVVFLINHERAEAGSRAQDALLEWAAETQGAPRPKAQPENADEKNMQ